MLEENHPLYMYKHVDNDACRGNESTWGELLDFFYCNLTAVHLIQSILLKLFSNLYHETEIGLKLSKKTVDLR